MLRVPMFACRQIFCICFHTCFPMLNSVGRSWLSQVRWYTEWGLEPSLVVLLKWTARSAGRFMAASPVQCHRGTAASAGHLSCWRRGKGSCNKEELFGKLDRWTDEHNSHCGFLVLHNCSQRVTCGLLGYPSRLPPQPSQNHQARPARAAPCISNSKITTSVPTSLDLSCCSPTLSHRKAPPRLFAVALYRLQS
jgi:hypothetical protein